MKLVVNGANHDHRGSGALRELLAEIGAESARVAVVINGRIVSREQREATVLKDGDEVDVLTLAGGG